MFTLRCTARLLKLVGASSAVSAPPTTRLGDWYANIVWGRPRVLLCVSERTLLPVLISGYGLRGIVPELQRSVSEVLLALDTPCGPLSMRKPMSATPELFASAIC